MSKINVKIKLNGVDGNIDLTTSALKTKTKINYNENNIKVTIILNEKEVIMKRVCNEYEIEFKFIEKENTISNYKLFGVSKIFDLETYTNKLLVDDNKLVIDYNLEGNDFSFILEVQNEDNIKTGN